MLHAAHSNIESTPEFRPAPHFPNCVGALIRLIRPWGRLYYNYNKETPNNTISVSITALYYASFKLLNSGIHREPFTLCGRSPHAVMRPNEPSVLLLEAAKETSMAAPSIEISWQKEGRALRRTPPQYLLSLHFTSSNCQAQSLAMRNLSGI